MRIPLFTNRMPLLAAALIAVAALGVAPVRARAQNPELDALLKKGVEFPGSQMRRLRPPTMSDGMTAAAQLQAIQAVLAMKKGLPLTYKTFVHKGLNSPSVLLVDEDPQYDSAQPGHSINLWFVVYGELKTVADPKFLKSQFKPDNKGRIDTLTSADLQQRRITPRSIPAGQEWFVHGKFQLLQTQILVQVQGTVRAVQTKTADSTTLACQIDRRFDSDSTYPNDWRSVVGGVVQNNPSPYYSCGGYAKVTKLASPKGAMLLEYHLVYDEPNGWFNGADLLRSKLHGTLTDENVRSFRREVHDAEHPEDR